MAYTLTGVRGNDDDDDDRLADWVSLSACLFVWLVGFLTFSSTTRLYRGQAPRQSV